MSNNNIETITINNDLLSNKLPKNIILRSTNKIKYLYENGHSFLMYPLKITIVSHLESVSEGCNHTTQVLFIVSKRNVKLATQRNLIRRRIRESFRLSQSVLNKNNLYISFSFIAKATLSYTSINEAVKKSIEKINLITIDTIN